MRVAVIGSGRRARANVDALRSSGAGDVIGLWSRDAETATTVAGDWGVAAHASIEALVTATTPDLVAIFTHPSFRADAVAQAVAAGARAFVIEKPIALDADELARVELAAAGCFVAINTQYRWMPHWQTVLGRIADGELGQLVQIDASTAVDVRDQGPHLLSLALGAAELGGLEPSPRWVDARGEGESLYGGAPGPRDLNASFEWQAARMTLLAGSAAPIPHPDDSIYLQQRVRISGTEGVATVTLNRGGEFRSTRRGLETIDTAWTRDDVLAQAAFWRDLARALHSPTVAAGFPTRLAAAALQQRALFGALTAAAGGQRVRLGRASG